MRFAVLGPLEINDGADAVVLGSGRLRVLFAALLVQAGHPVPADTLAEMLWDGSPPQAAASTLRSHVMRLRRALGPVAGARVITRSPGYQMEASTQEVDLLQFGAWCIQASTAAGAGQWERVFGLAEQALGLWRGRPLIDIPSQALCAQQVPHLDRLHLQALHQAAEAALRLGRHTEMLPRLESLAEQYPLDERFHAQLMRALCYGGRQADALTAYRVARMTLVDELGTEPGPELQRLHKQILTADPALTREPGPATAVHAAPGRAPASAGEVRFSLPPDHAGFTGRDAEMDRITAAVLEHAHAGGVIAIHAIGGMPGVGKTALAVHAAHLLRERFPGRCLFIDLHAHTPGHDPVPPETALAGLLATAGVDPRYLPQDLQGRAALWRDRMAGQRALLVLDNAATSAQVVPLLPGGDGCLVLVTSRRHLADLPGAAPLLLETLPPQQAREMFATLAPRAAGGPDKAVAELMRLAGYLPLAISLLARLFTRHPSWTLADLVTETKASLLSLAPENDSIAAAFELSYQHLNPTQQQFFGLLGLHPGATTDTYAAAALAGIRPAEASGLLDGLHGEGLLTETGYRRYGMHDLLRRYARGHATEFPAGESQRALERLLDFYQRTAAFAGAHLEHWPRPGPPRSAAAKVPEVPDLADENQALGWMRAERATLLACLDHATRTGQHARIISFTAALAELLRRDGPWADAITRHTTAIHAAQHLGDQPSQADALHHLGHVRRLTGDYPGAAGTLEQALGIFRDLGDQRGQAGALYGLGIVRWLTGDYPGAAGTLEQALGISRDLGNQRGQADTLLNLGIVRRLTGDYPGAAGTLEQALGIFRDLGKQGGQADALGNLGIVWLRTGDHSAAAQALEQALSRHRDLGSRDSEAEVLNDRGTLHRLSGELTRAESCHQQALDLARAISSPWPEAHALAGLGRCALDTGHTTQAGPLLRAALEIFQRIGAAEAQDLLTELDATTSPQPPP